MAIVHELSWSSSRDGNFQECRRRYYVDYYLSWLGWGKGAPKARQNAYLLKKMTRMPMLAGDLVHQAIQRYIEAKREGQLIDLATSQAWAVGELRAAYKTSRDGGWRMRPSKLTHFAEHHYEEACIDEKTAAAGEYGGRYKQRIEQCLANFYESPKLAAVRNAQPASFLACEDLSTFPLFETKVYAVPDFAFRADDGSVQVYDWKTGRENERDRFQLAVYTEYAVAQWGARPEDVHCMDVYLGDGKIVEQTFDAQQRADLRERIETSISGMRAVHFDADRGVGDPEAFPKVDADSAGARACGTCNYRELCDR
ncbi:MAG: hypothetical protein ACI8QC_001745 [Planctomycetota bacterium]|jgi:hypothetical protein